MAKVIFKQESGKHFALFPVNLLDKIPADHPVRLVNKVVDSLDLSAIIKLYKGGGTSAYHPRMLLKVLFYMQSINGTTIESACLRGIVVLLWLLHIPA